MTSKVGRDQNCAFGRAARDCEVATVLTVQRTQSNPTLVRNVPVSFIGQNVAFSPSLDRICAVHRSLRMFSIVLKCLCEQFKKLRINGTVTRLSTIRRYSSE